ncbi:MAG TPA: peptidylprolyl isomerase [Ignavibacteria bacterium]|nr:peptidylprolyl isomerase [Ignavibacteria bacterium]
MNFIKSIFLFVIIGFVCSANAQNQNPGDKILAVVGNDIILESDFNYQLQMYLRQNNISYEQVPPYLPQQIFQNMITEKIIYAKALQDSIYVTEDEIEKELDYRLKNLVDQFGSVTRIEEYYGMSIGKIRLELKTDLSKRLMSDKLKRRKFSGGVKLTNREVREFFEQYKDSLPPAPTEFEIANIYLERKVSESEKFIALEKIKKILDSLNSGVDFAILATNNSDDKGSAVNGGDLGYAKKGVFVKNFEEALFTLEVGKVSDIVETEYGYHLIRNDGKKGEEIKSSHILVAFPKLESSDLETISFLNSIRDSIRNGQLSFEDAAKRYSQDPNSKDKGGYVGFIEKSRLDSSEVEELNKTIPGGITDPIRIGTDVQYGYEILNLISINPEHKLDIDTDYDKIKKYAESFKENTELEKWINEMRNTIYVDIRVQ